MTIERLIRDKVRNGRAGSGGSWRIETGLPEDNNDNTVWQLWHYGTLMLEWIELNGFSVTTYIGTGQGSVSDQGGMNTAFRVLGLPFYFSRKGGSRIVETTCGQEVRVGRWQEDWV